MMLFRPLNRSINQIDWLFFEVFFLLHQYVHRKKNKQDTIIQCKYISRYLIERCIFDINLAYFLSNFFDIIHDDESDN